MRAHLYEFRSDKKKLKCLCGWERTLRSADEKLIKKMIMEHRADSAAKQP